MVVPKLTYQDTAGHVYKIFIYRPAKQHHINKNIPYSLIKLNLPGIEVDFNVEQLGNHFCQIFDSKADQVDIQDEHYCQSFPAISAWFWFHIVIQSSSNV